MHIYRGSWFHMSVLDPKKPECSETSLVEGARRAAPKIEDLGLGSGHDRGLEQFEEETTPEAKCFHDFRAERACDLIRDHHDTSTQVEKSVRLGIICVGCGTNLLVLIRN